MQLGILGLPVAGKTTIFNALTGSQLPTGALSGAARLEVRTAVVDVPDARLEALSRLYHPKKTTWAKVTYADIGGLQVDAGREGLPGELLNRLGQMDGFVLVVRAFDDPSAPHPSGTVDAARDLAAMEAEFLLNDMVVVERRLARLKEERQKGGRDRAAVDRELSLFHRLEETLSRERPLRTLPLISDEARLLTGFGLLSLKPLLVLINIAEGQKPPGITPPSESVSVLALQGKLESEIAQLPPEETRAYLAEYGIDESGRTRVLRASYELLGLLSFFTVSEEEVRSWRLRRGGTALEAAGTIHTDLARGFIRAEVIAWDELLALGGLTEARRQGKLRLEGKDYVVAEGEIVHIRFNV